LFLEVGTFAALCVTKILFRFLSRLGSHHKYRTVGKALTAG
jgi:hypothetical protein